MKSLLKQVLPILTLVLILSMTSCNRNVCPTFGINLIEEQKANAQEIELTNTKQEEGQYK